MADRDSPGEPGRGTAPVLADVRKELLATISVVVAVVGSVLQARLALWQGVRVLAAVVLLLAGLFLLVWLVWGRRHGGHGRPASTLLALSCVLTVSAGLWLWLTVPGGTAGPSPTALPTAGTGPSSGPATDAPPSSSTGASPSPAPSPSGLSGRPPPGTTSPGGSPTERPPLPPTTTGEDRRDTPGPSTGQAPPVNEQREVTLNTTPGDDSVWMDYWRQQRDRDGDLNMDGAGIATALGAQLAVMAGGEPDWFACRNAKGMTGRANFSALRVGTHLCARSREGRYARLRVIALPSSPAANGRFVFHGLVWHKGP